jgi:hypothetical protein
LPPVERIEAIRLHDLIGRCKTRSGIVDAPCGVVDKKHLCVGDLFLLGNHFLEAQKILPPFDFHLKPGIIFYAAAIKSASSLTPRTAVGNRWPFDIQSTVELSPTTAVIDNLRRLQDLGHDCQNGLQLLTTDQNDPIFFTITLESK